MGIIITGKRKSLGGSRHFRPWSEWKAGDEMVGKFVEMGRDRKFDKETYSFEVVQVSFLDGNVDTQGKDILPGQILTLNQAGSLSKVCKDLEKGTKIYIKYEGEMPLPPEHPNYRGGKGTFHSFKVDEIYDDVAAPTSPATDSELL